MTTRGARPVPPRNLATPLPGGSRWSGGPPRTYGARGSLGPSASRNGAFIDPVSLAFAEDQRIGYPACLPLLSSRPATASMMGLRTETRIQPTLLASDCVSPMIRLNQSG